MEYDQLTTLAEKIVPTMQEFGLSGFVLVGYMEDGDGKLQRVCIANTAKNPAFEDGLRPVISFAHVWGAKPPTSSAREFPEPTPPNEGG